MTILYGITSITKKAIDEQNSEQPYRNDIWTTS